MLDTVEFVSKEYVPLVLDWNSNGTLEPVCLFLEGGGKYEVDRYRYDGCKASRSGFGYGNRYAVSTSCDDEENYDKRYFLYLELFGQLGHWRCEELETSSVRVKWDDKGNIVPLSMTTEDGFVYRLTLEKQYPMSTRKSDGAGRRYITTGTCVVLNDRCREFLFLLEHGGDYAGSWFL